MIIWNRSGCEIFKLWYFLNRQSIDKIDKWIDNRISISSASYIQDEKSFILLILSTILAAVVDILFSIICVLSYHNYQQKGFHHQRFQDLWHLLTTDKQFPIQPIASLNIAGKRTQPWRTVVLILKLSISSSYLCRYMLMKCFYELNDVLWDANIFCHPPKLFFQLNVGSCKIDERKDS